MLSLVTEKTRDLGALLAQAQLEPGLKQYHQDLILDSAFLQLWNSCRGKMAASAPVLYLPRLAACGRKNGKRFPFCGPSGNVIAFSWLQFGQESVTKQKQNTTARECAGLVGQAVVTCPPLDLGVQSTLHTGHQRRKCEVSQEENQGTTTRGQVKGFQMTKSNRSLPQSRPKRSSEAHPSR